MRKVLCLLVPLLAFPGFLTGEEHKITPTAYHNTYSKSHPVIAKVRIDDRVTVRIPDAAGINEKGEKVAEPSNPLVGPIYVEGVEPGDAVEVRIAKLVLNRSWGWSSYRLGLFALTPDSIEGIFPKRFKEGAALPGRSDLLRWDIDLDKKVVSLKEPRTRRFTLTFPAQPMLGCIGLAAPGDAAAPSMTSGPWGGNMDYNAVAEGATVILPAYHPGGLLFIGDGHALQSDGEPLGTGIETSMEVQLQFGVVKKHPRYSVHLPRIETRDHMITIGSQPEFVSSLDRGLQMATTEMVNWLTQQWGAEPWEAHMMIGLNSKYEVVTVAGTVALRVPKSIIYQPPPAR